MQLENRSTNGSDLETTDCLGNGRVPTAQELFREEPIANLIALAIVVVFMLATFGIFVEEAVFINRHFQLESRAAKTLWVLAIYPVFSVGAGFAFFVPRAFTLVDLVTNLYFSICLYQSVLLMLNYLRGKENIHRVLGDAEVKLRSPPCCCCCLCCPNLPFTRKSTVLLLRILILQVVIVRPFILFVAAALWSNGSYTAGEISAENGYVYIAILNLISTLAAIWGLFLLQKAIKPALQSFHLEGKFNCLQLVLIVPAIPMIIISVLLSNGLIPCSEILPSKARSERIYNAFVVLVMLPVALVARRYFRRQGDGMVDDETKNGLIQQQTSVYTAEKQTMTSHTNLA